MNDINTRENIEYLVRTFYEQLFENELLSPIFKVVIGDRLEEHLPVLCNFWESILLKNMVYRGNPMIKHILLNQSHPLTDIHFNEWLKIWYTTIDKNFEGENAELAKTRASNIAKLMMFKIGNASTPN